MEAEPVGRLRLYARNFSGMGARVEVVLLRVSRETGSAFEVAFRDSKKEI